VSRVIFLLIDKTAKAVKDSVIHAQNQMFVRVAVQVNLSLKTGNVYVVLVNITMIRKKFANLVMASALHVAILTTSITKKKCARLLD
jgi:hypothetical protein